GYRFDRTGHLLHLRNPKRFEHILALLEEPPLQVASHSMVYSEGVYTRYPFQSNTLGLPPEVAYACVVDFLRAQSSPPSHPPTNFEEYCRAHFGNSISERFMLPYNRRLWGVEPREISSAWCDRFVPVPTVEDVIAGAVGHQTRELGYNATGIYPQNGIGELSSAIGRQLKNLKLRASPKRIDWRTRTVEFDGWSASYQALISTIPLPVLLRLLCDLPETVAQAAKLLTCTPLYYLDVALRRRPQVEMHWTYLPEERFPFYRVGNYAAFSPRMAPDGGAGLYLELAAREEPELPRLWPAIESCLVELRLIRSASDVAFCRLRHLEYAYVIYDQHRDSALSTINDFLRSEHIIAAGRYGAWNYSSMQDALEFGEQAVCTAQEIMT
ncbi:MAG: protoporphyrinogen/coproporphyrinogen oxidase, partial [Myxococcales bacterium]